MPGMADTEPDPHQDKVRTVPLPTNVGDGADRVITQQNQNPGVVLGGGEWPSPRTPPSDAAPGPVPDGTATRAEPAGDDGDFPPMREVLDADPVTGGSRSVPADDEPGEGDGKWGGSRLP